MLIGKILNSDATINNYYPIDSLSFIPGEAFTLIMQVFNEQSGLRKMILAFDANPAHISITISLPNKDGTDLQLVMTPFVSDASIWMTPVSAAQSALLAMGNLQFSVVDTSAGGPGPSMGWVEDGLSLVIIGDVP